MKNHTRLLFVAPTGTLDSGGEISHFELIKGAVRRGYEVKVVLPFRGSFSRRLKLQKISFEIVEYGWWDTAGFAKDGLNGFVASQKISEIANNWQSSLIVTNTLNLPWGALAAKLAKIPHVWIAREFAVQEFSYLKNRYPFIDNFSDLVIANSGNLATSIKNEFKVNHTKAFFSFVDTKGLELSQTKLLSDTRLVSIGAVQERKNQLELLKAVVILRRKYRLTPPVVLIGAVNSEYAKKLENYINKHGLVEQVTFQKFVAQPWARVTSNDILVQCSTSESIGRTVTEAMKLGVCCVGADIPGTQEAFSLGDGILYEPGNPAMLADRLFELVSNPVSRHKLSTQARKRALKNLSEKSCHDPFFDAIEKVAPRKNGCTSDAAINILVGQISSSTLYEKNRTKDKLNQLRASNKDSIKYYENRLKEIEDSKSWKAITLFRRFKHTLLHKFFWFS